MSQIKKMPKMKLGTDNATCTPAEVTVSGHLPCLYAPRMPSGTAISSAMPIDIIASCKVIGSRSAMVSATVWPVMYDLPRSPRTKSPSQLK